MGATLAAPIECLLYLLIKKRLFVRILFFRSINLSGFEGDHVATNLFLNRAGHIRILPQKLFGVLTSLTQTNITTGKPGTTLLDQAHFQTKVNQTTFARNALTIHNIELGSLKGRSHLILHHTDARAVAHSILSLFDSIGTTNIQTHRGVEFEGFAARRRFGIAKHHTDLL